MKSLIKSQPVVAFLIINYLISWTFLYPCYRMLQESDGFPPLALIGLIGAYGPSIAAIIVQYVVARQDLKSLLMKLVQVRVHWKLYAFIFLAPILLYLIASSSAILFHGEVLDINWIAGLKNIFFWVLVALPFGPMGEELGWRGFMLPRLLQSNSVVMSTVYVGIAWGIWHLASFTFPGAAIPSYFSVHAGTIALFILYTIALSFVYSYVHFKSGGSVFLAILLHAFFNAASNISADFLGYEDHIPIAPIAYMIFIVLVGLTGIFLLYKEKLIPHRNRVVE